MGETMGKAARLRSARANETDTDSADRYIEGFTVGRADRLRSHCVDAIRGLGYRAWDRESHIVITGGPFRPPGATLGFATIAREASRVGEEAWPGLVADIVGHLIESALAAPPHLGREELRKGIFPRFSAPGRIPEARLVDDYSYARWLGDMPLLLAVRHSHASAFLADIHLSKAGGAERAWKVAEANLFEAGLGELTVYTSPSGANVLVCESEHPRQAAWLAYPERLMDVLGLEIGPRGVLFCAPAHRILGIHVLGPGASVEDARSVINLAGILGEDEIAPLTQELFWWRPGHPVLPVSPEGVIEGISAFDTIDG
ncbi:hypothetical protein [Sinomonas humi]|nr:hypothetical protein [Sinomonas humi]